MIGTNKIIAQTNQDITCSIANASLCRIVAPNGFTEGMFELTGVEDTVVQITLENGATAEIGLGEEQGTDSGVVLAGDLKEGDKLPFVENLVNLWLGKDNVEQVMGNIDYIPIQDIVVTDRKEPTYSLTTDGEGLVLANGIIVIGLLKNFSSETP